MKSHTRVAVIGGGVVGCSVLYHLTKAGWTDVVLLERDQLTCGSTWHAAGGFHTLNGDPNVAKLQGYTIGLYDELERISGQSCGLHRSGGLLLADTAERMEWLKMAHGRARYLGLETSLLTPSEAKQLLPLIEEKYFVGAMLDAADGNLDPYGTTQAYAKSARIGGAEIYLQTACHGARAPPRRYLGCRHHRGHDQRRARRQCGRPLGARGRPYGRYRAAGAGDGAYVSRDRRHAGGRRVQPRARSRAAPRHRLQGRDLHAAGA